MDELPLPTPEEFEAMRAIWSRSARDRRSFLWSFPAGGGCLRRSSASILADSVGRRQTRIDSELQQREAVDPVGSLEPGDQPVLRRLRPWRATALRQGLLVAAGRLHIP